MTTCEACGYDIEKEVAELTEGWRMLGMMQEDAMRFQKEAERAVKAFGKTNEAIGRLLGIDMQAVQESDDKELFARRLQEVAAELQMYRNMMMYYTPAMVN